MWTRLRVSRYKMANKKPLYGYQVKVLRCHSQVVRPRSAKPLFSSSNLDGTSITKVLKPCNCNGFRAFWFFAPAVKLVIIREFFTLSYLFLFKYCSQKCSHKCSLKISQKALSKPFLTNIFRETKLAECLLILN